MNNATQETTTETKELTLTEAAETGSQADYERLRAGDKVEVEVKSEVVAQDAIIESEDDESETSQEEDEDNQDEVVAKEGKKPSRGFKKRIDKLNARLSEAQAQAEHWRQQALRDQKPEAKPEEIKAAPKGEPDSNDFETSTDFYKAHAKWAALEEIKAARESERQEKLKAEAETKKTTFQGKVKEFQKAHDDFEDVIADVDDIYMSPAISQAILESDNGPELMYELAKNREEYARMCSLSPFDAIRALGRFEAKLQREETKQITKPKTTTKAPPPAKPISSSSANGKKSLEDMNQSEYERVRNEQERRRASNF